MAAIDRLQIKLWRGLMRAFKVLLVFSLIILLASCSSFRHSQLPKVTNIQVFKADRTMLLINQGVVVKKYNFKLGFAPIGKNNLKVMGKHQRVIITSIGKTQIANIICLLEYHIQMCQIRIMPKEKILVEIFLFMERRVVIGLLERTGPGAVLRCPIVK